MAKHDFESPMMTGGILRLAVLNAALLGFAVVAGRPLAKSRVFPFFKDVASD